jgi:hypothetical protein
MKRRVLLCGLVLLFLSVSATAQEITEIELIFAPGMHSQFNAGTGVQHMQSFNGAHVYDDTGAHYSFTQAGQIINADFTGGQDSSAGGVASASFEGGSWLVQLYYNSAMVLKVSGGISWYDEFEKSPDAVHGEGHITVNWSDVWFDSAYWGTGIAWGAGADGKSAIKTDLLAADQPANGGVLLDYASNWTSPNARVFIYADSSNVVPEPATITLLGLGALTLVRRKRD